MEALLNEEERGEHCRIFSQVTIEPGCELGYHEHHGEKDGKYKGYFPDLECCYGEGDTIDDAIDDANEAARNWLSLELTEEDPFIPYVSDEEDIDLKEGEFIRNISVNIRFYEGWDE